MITKQYIPTANEIRQHVWRRSDDYVTQGHYLIRRTEFPDLCTKVDQYINEDWRYFNMDAMFGKTEAELNSMHVLRRTRLFYEYTHTIARVYIFHGAKRVYIDQRYATLLDKCHKLKIDSALSPVYGLNDKGEVIAIVMPMRRNK